VRRDFAHMRDLGARAVRLYHPPPLWLLDDALEHDLRVLIDVPWDKHRCFLEDWSAQVDALERVRSTARTHGRHPAVFALSVANEIPKDIVRFHGTDRVERFVESLLQAAKQEAEDCLVTYTNYPSSEFLQPAGQDFLCFNVYLDDPRVLGGYLDRLQHIAGPLPLILGEYGLDSLRHGEESQASTLREHVRSAFRAGLAGSLVFAYTDEWYTGGHEIEDWAFGITDRHRREKPAARALREAWHTMPHAAMTPTCRVSVVVCSYNGGATLDECLHSLLQLDYPDYEVILVDDGSTDGTREIAARYPQVRYIHQENHGLSVARNVGAEAATGDIVAYTDSDCVADELWLLQLVTAMESQQVEAIGGPNVTPTGDNWTARCVAVSPGNPSHVMLDDVQAEHVPGCNMAFRRDRLLELGGFDPQFRQAGDDVDVCWRFLDAGLRIGYAPSALVWHHRRNTVRAYCKQQKGYGRSEAMLHFKHPQRFNAMGCSRWSGVVYGDGAVNLPLATPVVYHGRFGTGLFQMVYRNNAYSHWVYYTLFEWHLLAGFLLVLAIGFPPLALVSAGMWAATLAAALRAAVRAPLESGGPGWGRPLVFALYLVQPVVRAYHRYAYRLAHKRLPDNVSSEADGATKGKRISLRVRDWYFRSQRSLGREDWLNALLDEAERLGWCGDFDSHWGAYDIELLGDPWHSFRIRTATEELGWPKRFTRVRCTLALTTLSRILLVGLALVAGPLAVGLGPWAGGAAALGLLGVGAWLLRSRRRCWRAVGSLITAASRAGGLDAVRAASAEQEPSPDLPSGVQVEAVPLTPCDAERGAA
jgi:glycosyltransferase involved in cell wall biosynthesis